ncbi:MAG: hypothetical protein JXJ04_27065, partial [Spirochaetales bacterium]|nr:hypothetical protein [Spirochaetales bacterium]
MAGIIIEKHIGLFINSFTAPHQENIVRGAYESSQKHGLSPIILSHIPHLISWKIYFFDLFTERLDYCFVFI